MHDTAPGAIRRKRAAAATSARPERTQRTLGSAHRARTTSIVVAFGSLGILLAGCTASGNDALASATTTPPITPPTSTSSASSPATEQSPSSPLPVTAIAPAVSSATATQPAAVSSAAGSSTEIRVIYPLDDNYQPLPGYTFDDSQSYQSCNTPSSPPTASQFGGSAYVLCAAVGGTHLDPCWPDSTTTMVCMSRPTDAKLIRVGLGSASPLLLDAGTAGNPDEPVRPWQIALGDGSACWARTFGALDLPGLSYVCEGNPEPASGVSWGAVGELDESTPVWTAPVIRPDAADAWLASRQSDPATVPTQAESIAVAYFPGAGSAKNPLPGAGQAETAAGVAADRSLYSDEYGNTLDFSSPSGNIRCVIGDGAFCEITDYTYVPPKPEPCTGTFGGGANVAPGDKPAYVLCQSNNAAESIPGGRALPYGQSLNREWVVFNPDGTLAYIEPRGSAHTPEGLRVGDSADKAFTLYAPNDVRTVSVNFSVNRFAVSPGSKVLYILKVSDSQGFGAPRRPL